MNVRGAYVLLERLKRRSHAGAHMSVSRIKADVQLQPRILNELEQALRRAKVVRNVLHQDLRAAVLGEDVQVLERGEGGVELAHVVLLAGQPEVDDEVAKRKLLGDFDGALDLVHGVDAQPPFEVSEGDRQPSEAAPVSIR